MTHDPQPLRLVAFDVDDLAVLSANLQDALIPVSELAYLPAERRFALAGDRFDWFNASTGRCERCKVGFHFDHVLNVAHYGFLQTDRDRVLNLLAIHFELADAPRGTVTLTFSGAVAIKLDVECLEVQMRDLGSRSPCNCQPAHLIDD